MESAHAEAASLLIEAGADRERVSMRRCARTPPLLTRFSVRQTSTTRWPRTWKVWADRSRSGPGHTSMSVAAHGDRPFNDSQEQSALSIGLSRQQVTGSVSLILYCLLCPNRNLGIYRPLGQHLRMGPVSNRRKRCPSIPTASYWDGSVTA